MSCKENSTSWGERGIREGSPEEVTFRTGGCVRVRQREESGRMFLRIVGTAQAKAPSVSSLREMGVPLFLGLLSLPPTISMLGA